MPEEKINCPSSTSSLCCANTRVCEVNLYGNNCLFDDSYSRCFCLLIDELFEVKYNPFIG